MGRRAGLALAGTRAIIIFPAARWLDRMFLNCSGIDERVNLELRVLLPSGLSIPLKLLRTKQESMIVILPERTIRTRDRSRRLP